MKGAVGGRVATERGAGVVICVPPVQPPAIDTYTCGLYVKSLLYARRTPTISVEKRVALGEEGTKYLQFSREIFQCGGESPRRKGCAPNAYKGGNPVCPVHNPDSVERRTVPRACLVRSKQPTLMLGGRTLHPTSRERDAIRDLSASLNVLQSSVTLAPRVFSSKVFTELVKRGSPRLIMNFFNELLHEHSMFLLVQQSFVFKTGPWSFTLLSFALKLYKLVD
ncbi:unnamed protein product [Leptidea sinapis]|uniref:Uncharacterized protein n=1 Tax=Leptidea sinapis TaxID=189913 RepID=A0A5E4Q898_9NEOP|nr:unnamed protein product [Leptidea sinapis]